MFCVVFCCRHCEGRGWVRNPWFEECRHSSDYATPGDCDHCPPEVSDRCCEGEAIPCPRCDGRGTWELWQDDPNMSFTVLDRHRPPDGYQDYLRRKGLVE